MHISSILFTIGLTIASVSARAELPALEQPLPLLSIEDGGELVYRDDDFDFLPWSSDNNPGKAHVLQYFGATMDDSETFEPFTDLVQQTFESGTVHVTTVIKLDAAMWGTSGFVLSELKKNKKIHPLSTMVIDEEGTGVDLWTLGDDGAGLAIMDRQGKVKYFTNQAMSPEELETALAQVKSIVGSP
jgi:YtfJ family uncharacterized protein